LSILQVDLNQIIYETSRLSAVFVVRFLTVYTARTSPVICDIEREYFPIYKSEKLAILRVELWSGTTREILELSCFQSSINGCILTDCEEV